MADRYTSQSSLGWLFAILTVAIVAVVSFLIATGKGRRAEGGPGDGPPAPGPSASVEPSPPPEVSVFEPAEGGPSPAEEERPEDILATLGVGVPGDDPEQLVREIARQLEAGDLGGAARIIGRSALDDEQLKRLRQLAGDTRLEFQAARPVTEIGELEINRRERWALNLAGEGTGRIYFDLARQPDGKWAVERIVLPREIQPDTPAPRAVMVDALGIADAFLQAALEQEFEEAKSFVDSAMVSDAKIAGLCIVFEEGGYRLRPKRPLRAMFNREKAAGFMANVQDAGGSAAAQFAMTLKREEPTDPWLVTEINFDQLLADYADRVAGGDVYFTPIIRNPEGGDTLILYFEFDEGGLTPRAERQLEIVSRILETDPKRKIRISGHTDALGSDEYNRSLSKGRAGAVKQFLIDGGVAPGQIVTTARGKSEPRRPNVTDSGEDDPLGRRVNRRTEIYLDF